VDDILSIHIYNRGVRIRMLMPEPARRTAPWCLLGTRKVRSRACGPRWRPQKYSSLVSSADCSTGHVGHLKRFPAFMMRVMLLRQITCPHLSMMGGLPGQAGSLTMCTRQTKAARLLKRRDA
jgi:hypothetical protein